MGAGRGGNKVERQISSRMASLGQGYVLFLSSRHLQEDRVLNKGTLA